MAFRLPLCHMGKASVTSHVEVVQFFLKLAGQCQFLEVQHIMACKGVVHTEQRRLAAIVG